MAAPPCHHQQDLLRHGLADAAEEIAGEIGRAPFAAARVHIEFEEAVPMGFGDIAPVRRSNSTPASRTDARSLRRFLRFADDISFRKSLKSR